ncbi:hypothetical protein Bbelb_317570 [Branchiostoma belcheri]|nr:hypothetical protein Bbelb_317570 [Branchiostoma belcheri]
MTLAAECGFGEIRESLIRDRILIGILDGKVRERLLRESNLSLEKCAEICRAAEVSKQSIQTMEQATVHVVKKKPQAAPQASRISVCKYCAKKHTANKEACPAYGKECASCGKRNHFARACRSGETKQPRSGRNQAQGRKKPLVHMLQEEAVMTVTEEEKTYSMTHTKTKYARQVHARMNLAGQMVTFQLDLGATCNVMPEQVLHKHNIQHKVMGPKRVLKMYNNTEIMSEVLFPTCPGQVKTLFGQVHILLNWQRKELTNGSRGCSSRVYSGSSVSARSTPKFVCARVLGANRVCPNEQCQANLKQAEDTAQGKSLIGTMVLAPVRKYAYRPKETEIYLSDESTTVKKDTTVVSPEENSYISSNHPDSPPPITMSDPVFVNPNSAVSMQRVLRHVGKISNIGRYNGKGNTTAARKWIVTSSKKVNFLAEARKAPPGIECPQGICGCELGKMGFRSEGAQRVARNCADHHKSMEMLQIGIKGSTDKMLVAYVREKLERGEKDTISADEFLFQWSAALRNTKFVFLQQQVNLYGVAIWNFRLGTRRNNAEYVRAGMEVFSSLFNGRNHPKYQAIDMMDNMDRAMYPPDLKAFMERTESVSSRSKSLGEGMDARLEEKNKASKAWHKGAPLAADWVRVFRNLDVLEKLRAHFFEVIGVPDSMSSHRYILEPEGDVWRTRLRSEKYLCDPFREDVPHTSISEERCREEDISIQTKVTIVEKIKDLLSKFVVEDVKLFYSDKLVATGLPRQSFAPWPKPERRGGGAVIPCEVCLEVRLRDKDAVKASLKEEIDQQLGPEKAALNVRG